MVIKRYISIDLELKWRDETRRAISAEVGGAYLRSGIHAEGVKLTISKDHKPFTTILTGEEARELGTALMELAREAEERNL